MHHGRQHGSRLTCENSDAISSMIVHEIELQRVLQDFNAIVAVQRSSKSSDAPVPNKVVPETAQRCVGYNA